MQTLHIVPAAEPLPKMQSKSITEFCHCLVSGLRHSTQYMVSHYGAVAVVYLSTVSLVTTRRSIRGHFKRLLCLLCCPTLAQLTSSPSCHRWLHDNPDFEAAEVAAPGSAAIMAMSIKIMMGLLRQSCMQCMLCMLHLSCMLHLLSLLRMLCLTTLTPSDGIGMGCMYGVESAIR